MTGDNPVIEFSSYYRHAVKVYEADFHGLTRNVGPFITSDLRIDPTHGAYTAVLPCALLTTDIF